MLFTTGPMVGGNWAVATFALVAIGSWYAPIQVIFLIRQLKKIYP